MSREIHRVKRELSMDINGIAYIVGFIAVVFLCGWALLHLIENSNL
jgi:hypothetical protein